MWIMVKCLKCDYRDIPKDEIPCLYCIYSEKRDTTKPGSDLWDVQSRDYCDRDDYIYWDNEEKIYRDLETDEPTEDTAAMVE